MRSEVWMMSSQHFSLRNPRYWCNECTQNWHEDGDVARGLSHGNTSGLFVVGIVGSGLKNPFAVRLDRKSCVMNPTDSS